MSLGCPIIFGRLFNSICPTAHIYPKGGKLIHQKTFFSIVMASWHLVREEFIKLVEDSFRQFTVDESGVLQGASDLESAHFVWYQQILFLLDFAVPLVRELDYILSCPHPDDAMALRFQELKKQAVVLQLIIGHPTRSRYSPFAVICDRYRDVIRSMRTPIADLDAAIHRYPYLLSSERLEILIGLAASGNGLNHLTSAEKAAEKWQTTLVSSILSESVRGRERETGKFHNVYTRHSPPVQAVMRELTCLCEVRLISFSP